MHEQDMVTGSEDEATLLVRIKRWTGQHVIILGPVIEELKEDPVLADIIWPDSQFSDLDIGSFDSITLPMPSAYPTEIQRHALFRSFVAAERNLWEGKANDLLRQLRTKLTCQSHINKQKRNFVGQVANTRNQQIADRAEKSVKALQNSYDAIFETMQILDPNLDCNKYRKIEDLDIIPSNLYHLKLNEKDRRIPWIWRSYQDILHTDKQIETWSEESKHFLLLKIMYVISRKST